MGLLEQIDSTPRVCMGWTTREPARFEFDLDAIERAADIMGVRWPIRVGCANYDSGRWSGMHHSETVRGERTHIVKVGRRCSPETASRVLWHELRHAEQTERLGADEFTRQYRAYGRKGAGYRSNPFEVEARRDEARAQTHPLAR